MKKKSFKGLSLQKYSVSNLALLHRKNGGNIETNTELGTTVPNSILSLYTECTIIYTNDPSDCISSDLYTCNCNTNNGTSKAQPPTEHQECPTNNNIHMH